MAETISLLLQVLLWPLCLGMIGLILLQGGAGDISSAFGGGGMLDSTLGVGASKKMAKVTGWLAAAFFGFVLFLAIPHKGGFGPRAPAPAAVAPAPLEVAAPNAPAQSTPPAPATTALTPPASAPVLTPHSAPKLGVDGMADAVKPVVEKVMTETAQAAEKAAALEALQSEAAQLPAAAVEAPKTQAPAVAVPAAPAQ